MTGNGRKLNLLALTPPKTELVPIHQEGETGATLCNNLFFKLGLPPIAHVKIGYENLKLSFKKAEV